MLKSVPSFCLALISSPSFAAENYCLHSGATYDFMRRKNDLFSKTRFSKLESTNCQTRILSLQGVMTDLNLFLCFQQFNVMTRINNTMVPRMILILKFIPANKCSILMSKFYSTVLEINCVVYFNLNSTWNFKFQFFL